MYKYTKAAADAREAAEAAGEDESPTASEAADASADCWYELRGIVVHSGTANVGHYYSYIKVCAMLASELCVSFYSRLAEVAQIKGRKLVPCSTALFPAGVDGGTCWPAAKGLGSMSVGANGLAKLQHHADYRCGMRLACAVVVSGSALTTLRSSPGTLPTWSVTALAASIYQRLATTAAKCRYCSKEHCSHAWQP